MSVNVALIKQLRERTGAGMVDCKKALEENNNDVDLACDWLREKGIAKAAKKASRIAAEGLSTVVIVNNDAIVIEVNCETDFVAKSDAFKALVDEIAHLLLSKHIDNIDDAKAATESLFTDATVKIGEKLDLRRVTLVHKADDEKFGSYIHFGGKIACLVLATNGESQDLDGLAMHITAEKPLYIDESEIPQEEIARETEIQMENAKNDEKLKSKPEKVLASIIQGKVNKHFEEMILVKQNYALDSEVKVGQFLKSKNIVVKQFVRYETGEGIAKRVENFAEEVEKQAAK